MSINYNEFYQVLEMQVSEGVKLLSKINITHAKYSEMLSNLVTTANLVKTFGEIVPTSYGNKPQGIKEGDVYTSLDGSMSERKVVVFYSDSCSFCNLMKPVYLPYFKDSDVQLEEINTSDENSSKFAAAVGIEGIPAYLLVKDGVVKYRFEGFNNELTKEEHYSMLEDLLSKYL